jgi:hypothetical protein
MPQFHELADIVPLMEGEAFERLVEDVRAHGVLDAIVLYEGKILDGRNRYRALDEVNKGRTPTERMAHREIKFEERYPDTDPAEFVWSKNVARRQMTPGQEALAASKMSNLKAGSNQYARKFLPGGEATRPDQSATLQEVSKTTGVPSRSIKRAGAVQRKAIPEVTEKVASGALPLFTAEKIAELPEEKQAEVVELGDVRKIRNAIREAKGEAPVNNGAPGRGRVGPKILMARHMDLPDLSMVQKIGEDWEENVELIKELDPERVTEFLAMLKKSRTATTRLINLIEHGDVRGTLAKSSSLKTSGAKGNAASTTATAARKKAAPKASAAKKAPGTITASGAPTVPSVRKTVANSKASATTSKTAKATAAAKAARADKADALRKIATPAPAEAVTSDAPVVSAANEKSETTK